MYVFVCLPFSLLCLSLTLCEFPALSLSVGVCVCVCVCVCVWRNVPYAPKTDFLHVGLSLVSLPLRLCLGHLSACHPISGQLHFWNAKASTT